ncbi:MAG: right-handed parallel beta-helix repeat-containing protein [Spirochaetaceae bacterium]|jgi:hypothetical protein|nr:right-handed parallel beta-helix repeat-containing protein [Spirochaetaceae bacterium]
MKMNLLFRTWAGPVLFLAVLFLSSCAPKSLYVGAGGNDADTGKSERAAFKTLTKALEAASKLKKDCTIVVAGVLSVETEGGAGDSVFLADGTGEAVITISGKAGAEGDRRAVLSGAGASLPVLLIRNNAQIRLENIEVSGASDGNDGIVVTEGSTLTLGPGVKVSDHSGAGIVASNNAAMVMEGGEISGNQNRGVEIATTDSTFVLKGGKISNNKAPGQWGAGVHSYGAFTMEGGEISENLADKTGRGGGVCVDEESTFTLRGGKIVNNRSEGFSSRNGGVGNAGGGGVVVSGCANGTTFIMEGGEISGNSAERFGGGILFITNEAELGTFTMSGGTISGNTARGGGGVCNYGGRFTVTLSGGEISGNTPDDITDGWNW